VDRLNSKIMKIQAKKILLTNSPFLTTPLVTYTPSSPPLPRYRLNPKNLCIRGRCVRGRCVRVQSLCVRAKNLHHDPTTPPSTNPPQVLLKTQPATPNQQPSKTKEHLRSTPNALLIRHLSDI